MGDGLHDHTRFESGALTVCISRLLGAAERRRIAPLIEILAAVVAGRDPIPNHWDREQWERTRFEVGTWLNDLFDKAYPKPLAPRRRVSAPEALTIYWNSDVGRRSVYWNGAPMERAESDKVWPLEGIYEVEGDVE